MHLACTLFGLTPLEALDGATRHGARALGLGARKGALREGADADFVIWDATAPEALAYWLGGNMARSVFAAGRLVAGRLPAMP
jgi:imidazolonepropionase